MYVCMYVYVLQCYTAYLKYVYRIAENVGRRNIGEFGKMMANCQSFLPQIYGISISIFYL